MQQNGKALESKYPSEGMEIFRRSTW